MRATYQHLIELLDTRCRSYLWLRGHDVTLHVIVDRMYLGCVSCHVHSPGWSLPNTRPRPA